MESHYLDYLNICHSGIKGMKWGVRKEKLKVSDFTLAKYKLPKTEEGSGFENDLKSKDPETRLKSRGQLTIRGGLDSLGGYSLATLIKEKAEQIVKENPDNYTYNKSKRIKRPDIPRNYFGPTIIHAVQLNRKY